MDFKEQLRWAIKNNDNPSVLGRVMSRNAEKILALLDAVDEVEASDHDSVRADIDFDEQMDRWVKAHKAMYKARAELGSGANEPLGGKHEV